MIMMWTGKRARWSPFVVFATAATFAFGATVAQSQAATFEGKSVRIGHGKAHTLIRSDANGKVESIGVVFTPGMLEGLPKATKGADPDFPYLLPMAKL
jgi:hypothetical protein